MGGVYSAEPKYEVKVDREAPSKFDPLYGFPEGRQKREMKVTPEQMESAMIPLADRGYCAHKLMDLKSCIAKEFPLNYRCKHVRHSYHECLYDDSILQYKEFERERRLLERQAKKEAREKRLAEKEKAEE